MKRQRSESDSDLKETAISEATAIWSDSDPKCQQYDVTATAIQIDSNRKLRRSEATAISERTAIRSYPKMTVQRSKDDSDRKRQRSEATVIKDNSDSERNMYFTTLYD
jgi:hypothetical protein